MPVGLFPRESADILAAQLDQGTSAPPEPGFFAGFNPLARVSQGVQEGAAEGVFALQPDHQAVIGYNLPESAYTKPQELSDDEYRQQLARDTSETLKHFQADPHVVGMAGQTLQGLASGISQFVTGSAIGGPVGGAVVVGGSKGRAAQRELTAQGVDENTANALGAASALFAGGASLLPGGYGKDLVNRILTGAGANVTSGIVQRGLTHNVLDDAGYKAQADQYRALDASAMTADAVLGAGFGAAHHLFTPSVQDAARTVQDADHVETATPGGAVPAAPADRDAHVANMTAAAEALLRGDDIPPLKDVEMVPNPAAASAGEARAADVQEAAGEVLGEPVAPPEAPQVERRADAIESARLGELRAKRNAGDLTDAEKDELLTLQERDRLASKVGGRRIQGVQTDEAYAEMLARGEGKPVQGFVDMDMLKALNDSLGHGAGDDAIRTLGETLAHYFGEGNVFRRSSSGAGDEFIVHASDQAAYDAAVDAARQHLANHTIRAYDADGNLIGEQKGVAFSHGSGKTVELAEQAAYADKQLRARQGLRRDRPDPGSVPAEPAAAGSKGGNPAPARSKAGGKVTAARATTELTNALRDLAADPTNARAHAAVRSALDSIQNSGLDAGAIERSAVERGGDGAGRVLEAARASERPAIDTGGFDPATREAVDQAQAILERRGDEPIAVTNEASGAPLPAREALDRAVDELKNAQGDGELTRVAAACFGRG